MLLHAEELPKRILQYTRRQKVEWDNQQYWRISFQTETCTEVGTDTWSDTNKRAAKGNNQNQ